MPAGELFIKFQSGMSSIATSARYNYSNGTFTQNNSGTYIDAFKQWGMSMDSTALSNLMTPAPLKGMVENKSALENGKRVDRDNRKLDERTLTLGFSMWATSKETFLSNYSNFCTNVLAAGKIDLRTKYQSSVEYHLDYLSCQSFGEYAREMAKFVLRVGEANPGSRS